MSKLEKSWLNPFSSRKKFISSSISCVLLNLLDRKKYVPVNESYIDIHDLNSEQPDVVVYDVKSKYDPSLIIECSEHSDLDLTINSIEILSSIYHIPESFVYDLDEQIWYKVGSPTIKNNSFSAKLNFDLAKALNQSLLRYY